MARTSKRNRATTTQKTQADHQPKAELDASALAKLESSPNKPVSLMNVWQITKAASSVIWQHRVLFIGITVVYGFLNVLLAQGLAHGNDITTLKNSLNEAFSGNFGSIATGLSIFVVLIGTAGNTSSQTAGAYQTMLSLIASLAIIWSLRQVLAGNLPRIRDSFYQGMYPLIPFILVLSVIALQLIPLLIGSTIYAMVINNGIAVHLIEKIVWFAIFAGLAAVSLYMISASLFAIYIVTLPGMTPIKSLKTARELVAGRRLRVLLKIISMPIILIVAAAIVMLPIIIILTPLSQYVFFLLTMFSLVAIHAYMYTLYRNLINE